MDSKTKVLEAVPSAYLYAETLSPGCQSRLVILDEAGNSLGWAWGIPGVAACEVQAWDDALNAIESK